MGTHFEIGQDLVHFRPHMARVVRVGRDQVAEVVHVCGMDENSLHKEEKLFLNENIL